ncbi:MAG TPA: hypothetical protein VHF02_06690 [Luteimonas sp.]|nr:hypothetical protein [Luteimonas sp.]
MQRLLLLLRDQALLLRRGQAPLFDPLLCPLAGTQTLRHPLLRATTLGIAQLGVALLRRALCSLLLTRLPGLTLCGLLADLRSVARLLVSTLRLRHRPLTRLPGLTLCGLLADLRSVAGLLVSTLRLRHRPLTRLPGLTLCSLLLTGLPGLTLCGLLADLRSVAGLLVPTLRLRSRPLPAGSGLCVLLRLLACLLLFLLLLFLRTRRLARTCRCADAQHQCGADHGRQYVSVNGGIDVHGGPQALPANKRLLFEMQYT